MAAEPVDCDDVNRRLVAFRLEEELSKFLIWDICLEPVSRHDTSYIFIC